MNSKTRGAAKSRILQNPFNVAPDDVNLYQPEIQLYRLHDGLVHGKVRSRQTLLSLSRDLLIDDRISTTNFAIPAMDVSLLVKWCRRQGVECAVLQDVSAPLQLAASYRKQIGPRANSPVLPRSDIVNSLFAPYFDFDEQRGVCLLNGASFPLLVMLFPSLRFRSQSDYFSKGIPLKEFPLLAWRAQTIALKVWYSLELVRCFLDRGIDLFDESLLCIKGGAVSWCCTGAGGAALYLPSELKKSEVSNFFPSHIPRSERSVKPLQSVISDLADVSETTSADARVVEIQECYFDEFFETVSDRCGEFFKTVGFVEFLERRRAQKVQLQFRNTFNRLSDYPLKIENSDLASKLFPHQRVAVEWVLRQNFAFIGDDMGLGKTLSVLTAMQELLAQGAVFKGLIICPNSLCLNWEREIGQWIPGFSALTVPKSPLQRTRILNEFEFDPGQKVLILNYEIARTPKVHALLLRVLSTFDTFLCIDESQRVKNPLSKTFKMLSTLAQQAKRRVLLSGTPTPKDITDIWSQVYLLDLGERFGSDYHKWLTSIAELGNQHSAYAVRRFFPKQVEFTQRRVQEILLRRKKERVIKLPEKSFIERNLELSGSQLERYEEIRKDLRVRLMSAKGKVFTREMSSILEQYLRAVQISSNPRLVDPSWTGTPAKFTELDFLLEELVGENEQKVVIWTNYVGNTVELAQRYASYGAEILAGSVRQADRQAIVSAFQASVGGPRVIIALPAVAGVGLTLTRAQYAIYLDKTWNAEHWLQSIDRIHRIGQTGNVSIISLHASKVDWLISANLKRKVKAQSALMDGEISLEGFPTREELLAAV